MPQPRSSGRRLLAVLTLAPFQPLLRPGVLVRAGRSYHIDCQRHRAERHRNDRHSPTTSAATGRATLHVLAENRAPAWTRPVALSSWLPLPNLKACVVTYRNLNALFYTWIATPTGKDSQPQPSILHCTPLELRAVRRVVLDSYVLGSSWSLYQVCEVQRSASEIHRAPVQVQIGLTGTVTVSTKVQSCQWKKVSEKERKDY
jgi:hypothetical protein